MHNRDNSNMPVKSYLRFCLTNVRQCDMMLKMPKPKKTEMIFARVTEAEKKTALKLAERFKMELSDVIRHGLALFAQSAGVR